MIDLIIIALVAAIVISRFTKFKLPTDLRDPQKRRVDLDRLRGKPLVRDDAPNVVDITSQSEATKIEPTVTAKAKEQAKNLTGVAKIAALDPGFKDAEFLEGAQQAYGYFYACWNRKDAEGLENLCAPALYERLVRDMESPDWCTVTVEDLRGAVILDARVHGRSAVIDVEFDTREREGDAHARDVKRRWTLARPLGSDDPNWELEAIETGVDA